jgi:pectate lyase
MFNYKIMSPPLALLALSLAPLVSYSADGYGRNATGGAGGSTVTVTTAAALQSAVASTATSTIIVSGTINLGASGHAKMTTGNKTIKGANTSATVLGTIELSNVNNVIIQNLNISANTGAAGVNDGITCNGSTNVYMNKLTVYDCTDGNIDVCKGSDYVTVSWCKFYYTRNNGHNFSNLIGSSDTDTGGYHSTWHHNWWSTGCIQRMPADRFGPCHVYNNYFDCVGNDYCTTSRNVSQQLNENNYYNGVKNPLAKVDSGKLKTSGNVFNNCTGTQTSSSDTVFTPNYGYTLDTAAAAVTRVKAGAGNR